MFETAIAYYLNEYLGSYVEGIDKEALSVSVLNGDVVLRNSTLKPDAVREHLDLPVSVRAGMLETLTLKVPWNALGSTPVVVTMDGLYLLVRAEDTSGGSSSSPASGGQARLSRDYFDEGLQSAKMARVQKKERAWVSEVEKREAALRSDAQKKQGFLSSLIETVVGNLQISIRNIHIRYEDDVTRPGHSFACGFTLQNLEAFTIDASGGRSFVSARAMDALRKAVQLRRMSVYFDCNLARETLWSPSEEAWRVMAPVEWGKWFGPAIVGDKATGTSCKPPSYVLLPVDGQGKYVRMKDSAEMDVRLDSVAVSVSRDQYQNYSMLLSEASEYVKRLPFLAFRPKVCPVDDPRAWWLYLMYAHRQQAELKRTLPWGTVIESVRSRSRYTSLYKVVLKMDDILTDKTGVSGISDELMALYERDVVLMHELETRLPESCIVAFRRAARAEYLAEIKAEKAAAAAERQTTEASNSGWLGWLMGTGASAPTAITTVTTKEEQDVIVDALAATTIGGRQGEDSTGDVFGKKVTYAVRVNSVSINLIDGNVHTYGSIHDDEKSQYLLQGSMSGICIDFVAYPGHDGVSGTRDVQLHIDGSAIDSHRGLLTESKGMTLHFVRNPPTGLADASLTVDVAPSFIYYDPEVVARVVDFFKPPEELVLNDLADLSVAAAAQLSRARQIAQEYAIAAWSSKPKLDMRLMLSAPKISIPSKAGDVHLALDFGMFVIESDYNAALALSPRERGLYECIRVTGSQVSARFMGSVVDWGREDARAGAESEESRSCVIREPLLDNCSLNIALHVARYVDAGLPAIRAYPTVPRIRLAVSPDKVNHLLRVLQNCVESFHIQDANTTVTAVSEEAWLSSAEWRRDCLVLQWGTLQSSATWKRQRLVMYAATLYVVEAFSSRVVRQWTVSPSSLASRLGVGSDSFRDADRVVVLHDRDASADIRDVVRDRGSLVVKFDTVQDLDSCVEELHRVVHGQSIVETSPSASQEMSEVSVSIPTKFSQSESALHIEVHASLTELEILLAGRCCSADSTDDLKSVEVNLVRIKASEGKFRFDYGSDLRIAMSLVSMDVEDLLSSNGNQFLAHSMQGSSASTRNLADFEILSSGLQTSVHANLGSLCFFCNRPTVAALISFGTDTAAAFADQREQRVEYSTFDAYNQTHVDKDAMDDVLAPEVVIFCEKNDAVTFALRVQLAKLEFRMCYEDDTNLAGASVNDVLFALDNISDGRSKITASLGNLHAVDLSLAGGNPHANICGLRDEGSTSLVSIALDVIPAHVKHSLHSLNVPPNTLTYYLEARMSKLKVTFLYRFVQECVLYISGLLRFRPPPLDVDEIDMARQEPGIEGTGRDSNPAQSPTVAKTPLASGNQSSLLMLNISMDAPLITVPRSSTSDDGFRADLGTLNLENEVIAMSGDGGGLQSRQLDVSTLKLSGISLYPTSIIHGDRESLLRISNEGWTVVWRRQLGEPLRSSESCSRPAFEIEVDVPVLDASISNEEYSLIKTVLLDNLYEPVTETGQEVVAVPFGSMDMKETGDAHFAGTPRTGRASIDNTESHTHSEYQIDYRVYVHLGKLQLYLVNPAPLGFLQVENLYVSYTAFGTGGSCLDVSMPKLEVADMRSCSTGEDVGKHESAKDIVISSGQHASMLMLRYSTGSDGRLLDIILQKPQIALELGFLIELTEFFLPKYSFSKSEPLPFETGDILLKSTPSAPLILTEDLWLSPAIRILADAVPGSTYCIDGNGHAIILPDVRGMYDEVPLIMIGTGCTLQLYNLTLMNADALSSCIRFGPGARLDLSSGRGVRLKGGNEDSLDHFDEEADAGARISGAHAPNSVDGDNCHGLNVNVRAVNLGLNLMPRKTQCWSNCNSGKKIIAFKLDLETNYSYSTEGEQSFKLDVRGLRASQKSLKQQSVKATKEMDILLPLTISLGYTSTKEDIDLKLDISEVSVLLSPGSLALMTQYAEDALLPLRQPGPESPVCAVSAYRKIASPPDTNGLETWISFWRPAVPSGYVVAGDLAVGGDQAPSFEVLVVARNSGLVAHPESFLPVVTNKYLSLWLPVAPPGYVALGLFATTSAPPNPSEVACVACDAVVKAPRGSSLMHWGGFDGISLVNLDNSFGSFIPEDAGAFDLRFPVGPTTYALSTLNLGGWGGLGPPLRHGESLQKSFTRAQLKKQRGQSRSINSPKTMEFRRIWRDTGGFSGPAGVSIWRPVPHPGYAILGDCFVSGMDPPKFVHLLRMESYSIQTTVAVSAPPVDFEFVWHDGNPRPEARLTIWSPIAPDGYLAMGNIAQIGMVKPELPELCCVSKRLAIHAAAPRRPVWRVARDHLGAPPLNVWQVDDLTKCFSVDFSDKAVPPHQAVVLDMTSLEGSEENPSKTVNYVVRSVAVDVTFFDSLGGPMLRTEVRNIESGIRGFHQEVAQVYGGLRPSLMAYNHGVGTWEHVVQPFDAILTGYVNLSEQACSGIDPGVRVTLKSSTEMIATTLALSHVNAMVSSYDECIAALGKANRAGDHSVDNMDRSQHVDRDSVFGGRARRTSILANRLGVDVDIRLEDIDTGNPEVVRINQGEAATIQRTYHSDMMFHAHTSPGSGCHEALLLVDVKGVTFNAGSGRDGSRVAVSSHFQHLEETSCFCPRTRAVVVNEGHASFQERLVLLCDVRKVEAASCVIELWDVEAGGGLGAIIGLGTIPHLPLHPRTKPAAPFEVAVSSEGTNSGIISCSVFWQRLGAIKKRMDGKDSIKKTLPGIVGRRAISIQGSNNAWNIVPETKQRPETNKARDFDDAVMVRTAVQCGKDTVILEGHIEQHIWHEMLRSNCRVNNATGIALCAFASYVDGVERSLGTLAPGGGAPLPFGWQRPGVRLHVTPALYERGGSTGEVSSTTPALQYAWGSVEIALLMKSSGDGSMCNTHKSPLECVPAIPGNGLSMMFCLRSSSDIVQEALDWKIDIVPPIRIRNHVPVPVSMFVADGGMQFSTSATADFPVNLDIVEPGADLPIYFTGSTNSLRFRMDAGEYKWAERELACLTGAGQREYVRLQSDTQRIPSDIVLSRYQTSPKSVYPVVITLVSPIWILNKTDWMVETAVVPVIGAGDKGTSSVTLDPQHSPHEDCFSAVLMTSVEDSGTEVQGTLVNSRQISPQSLVLSSIPAGLASNGATSNQTRAYGIRVRVQRSGWTDPILLDEEYAVKHGLVALSSRPLLLKADSPPHSAVFGVVLRLEMSEFNDSRILHIDAQMVLQNSCRVDLEGFQTVIDCHRQRHLHTHGNVGSQSREPLERDRIVLPRGGVQLEDPSISNASFVQMADNSIQSILKAKAIWTVPADSIPRPLTFLRGAGAPTLCFRRVMDTSYENVGIWSRPLQLDVLDEGLEYVILPSINAGSLEATVLLRLRVSSRGPGLRLITLESTECLPQYVLANKGPDDLLYRETGWRGATKRPLPGLSAVGIVPSFSTTPDAFELEIFGVGMDSYARTVRLSDRSGDFKSSVEPVELVISSSKSCMLRTSPQPPKCLSFMGMTPIAGAMSGYTVGWGGVEKTVDVSGVNHGGRRRGGALPPPLSSGDEYKREVFLAIEVPGISLSVIDFRREIVLLTLDDVKVEFDRILMPNSTGSHFRAVAKNLQLDNQLPGTLLPVAICKAMDSRSALPVIDFRHSSYQSKNRAGQHIPYIVCRTPNKMQLAVEERLVWKMAEFIATLKTMGGRPNGTNSVVRSIDALVRLRLLSVSPMALSVSFQNNSNARPPSFQESSYSLMLDLAAFKGADVTLKGFEFENLHVTRSSLSSRVVERIRSELVAAGFSLIRQFGIVGGATRLFGYLGAKVARFAEGPSTISTASTLLNLSGTSTSSQSSALPLAAPEQEPSALSSFGSSVIKGFRGVVGAFAAPITRAQEKQDASFAKGRSDIMVLQRKRLPRVLNEMSGIRDAQPIGNELDPYHQHTGAAAASSRLLESLGQAFLWSTWIASPLTQGLRLEGFEEHFVLPNHLVLLFTSASMLLVYAPGFAALDGAAELGSVPAEVDPGTIQWRVMWCDVLRIELVSRMDPAPGAPDVVIFHLRDTTLREVVCLPDTPQASQIKLIASKMANKTNNSVR